MSKMKLAACLYKYFPFGGLARDFLRIMSICRDRGYEIDVYVMEWHGEIPEGFNVYIIPLRGWSNHAKIASYIEQITPRLQNGEYDLVIGFNKIPGLDLYYAADPCYLDRVKKQKNYFLQVFSRRLQFYAKCEHAVFSTDSKTVALMISDVQCDLFKKNYGTPNDRLIMLPPGIDELIKRPSNWLEIRQTYRNKFGIKDDNILLLMVGTAFKTKGVDRAIRAIASLPEQIRQKTKLFILGDGVSKPYMKLARKLLVQDQVVFFGGRTDVPHFLLGADLLLHSARKDNTGTVILEAIVAGLPVLVTQECGYAKHVLKANAGIVIPSPFKQQDLNLQLANILQTDMKAWSGNGLEYSHNEDLYSMPEKVVKIIENMAHVKRKENGD